MSVNTFLQFFAAGMVLGSLMWPGLLLLYLGTSTALAALIRVRDRLTTPEAPVLPGQRIDFQDGRYLVVHVVNEAEDEAKIQGFDTNGEELAAPQYISLRPLRYAAYNQAQHARSVWHKLSKLNL